MTDITEQDEREARRYLEYLTDNYDPVIRRHAQTILALLDRPRMPHPASVPDEVWQAANDTFHRFAYTVPGIQAAYRALYDHYNPPPAPVKVEAWGIAAPNGEIIHVRKTQDAARQRAKHCPDDVRIVHLVEAEHD